MGEDLRRSCRPSEFLAQLVRKRSLSPGFLLIRGAATGAQVPSRAASLGSPSRSALPVSAGGWARVARIAPPIPMGVHSAAPPLGPASLFDLWARSGTRRRVNSSSAFRAASLACWRANIPPGSPSVSLPLLSATHLLFAGGKKTSELWAEKRPPLPPHPRRIDVLPLTSGPGAVFFFRATVRAGIGAVLRCDRGLTVRRLSVPSSHTVGFTSETPVTTMLLQEVRRICSSGRGPGCFGLFPAPQYPGDSSECFFCVSSYDCVRSF